MMKNERAYIAILEACVNHHRPLRHSEWDVLTLDRKMLGLFRIPEEPYAFPLTDGEPFGYILRELGTELLRFYDARELKTAKEVIDHYSAPFNRYQDPKQNPLWFFWDGSNLIQCDTAEELWERISKTYLHRDEERTRSESH